jgi:hypothetical protein
MNTKITQLLKLIIILIGSISVSAQNQNLWKVIDVNSINTSFLENRVDKPKDEVFYRLDFQKLQELLENAPSRSQMNQISGIDIPFPSADGKIEIYKIFSAPVLSPELQENYPYLKAFIGKNVENPRKIIRFSLSDKGIKVIKLNGLDGTEYIDFVGNEGQIYSSYYRKDLTNLEGFICDFVDDVNETDRNYNIEKSSRNANDGVLRTYRLAVATTLPFSSYHINQAGLSQGTNAQKRAAVLAVINDIMTRVNAVFENELSITMEIVAGNENIISVTQNSLTSNNNGALLDESTPFINSGLGGASNYDIGHMLTTNGGGVAYVSQACQSLKGGGISGSPVPEGANFEAVIMHEMGHQYGSRHTFNGNAGSCLSNISPSSAYEPGSGSTIMAYPGLCGTQNVQNTTDLYFHQKSLDAIWLNVSQGNSQCAQQESTGNIAPVIQLPSSNYVIPVGTPYKLDVEATDADGNETLSYCWEQYDLGPSGVPSLTTLQGPLVRSRPPSTNTFRYIPVISEVLANGGLTSTWEVLVLVPRPINYKITVRDNDIRGSQLAVADLTLQTVNAGGIFRVTSQNTAGLIFDGDTSQTVTWDVAGTTGSGINVSNVNILLSVNGGESFDIVLVSNTPNDGSQSVTLPPIDATNCRIMVEAVGNIFYNVNTRDFEIQAPLSVTENQFSNLKIYPNPTTGKVNISFQPKSNENIILEVYDIRGRAILNQTYQSTGRFEETLTLDNAQSGMYLLSITNGNQKVTKKIIVD